MESDHRSALKPLASGTVNSLVKRFLKFSNDCCFANKAGWMNTSEDFLISDSTISIDYATPEDSQYIAAWN